MSNRLERMRAACALDARNRWIGGVCAGIARRFEVDPAYLRVGAIVAGAFYPKAVVVAYLAAWILLRERED